VPSTVIDGPLNTLAQPRATARKLASECVADYELSRGLHREASWLAEMFGPIRI
jgi:hypothetical protein